MTDQLLDILDSHLSHAFGAYACHQRAGDRDLTMRALGRIEVVQDLLQQHCDILETWGGDEFFPGLHDRMRAMLAETREVVPAAN